jgi:hypothetical protein
MTGRGDGLHGMTGWLLRYPRSRILELFGYAQGRLWRTQFSGERMTLDVGHRLPAVFTDRGRGR